jgi:hypothetical protein
MDQEWVARASGWIAAVALSWAILAAISLYGPVLLLHGYSATVTLLTGGISGIFAIATGASARTAATVVQSARAQLTLNQFVSLAGIVFAVFLGILLSWIDRAICSWLYTLVELPAATGFPGTMSMIMAASAALVSIGVSFPVNVNRFSLHALYRNRLIRAFLGSARGDERNNPDPFTGFDPTDNVLVADTLLPKTRDATQGARLFHVINIALNVVSSKRLAWQERKAESFSVTAQACGNPHVGYRPAKYYGAPEGMSLGTAMAISGAAISPDQGYHSSPVIGFLLMLFNARLGWWLGNPINGRASRRQGPTFGLFPALRELSGATSDDDRWVYLSDGGHFENLGIYEMVRRHCRYIVVSDAGCDPETKLEDLGNAARKCFIDFGVQIDFKELNLPARPESAGAYCAMGEIKYPGVPYEGWILYVKPAYHGSERPDIRGYAMAHSDFPHESTVNQWFSESQFEAYRALGEHIFDLICHGDGKPRDRAEAPDLRHLRTWAAKYVESATRPPSIPDET